jgi:hypothetical protein
MSKLIELFKNSKFERIQVFIVVALLLIAVLVITILLINNQTESVEEANQFDRPANAVAFPETATELSDFDSALPYSGQYFTVFDTTEENVYRVEYAPFLNRNDAEELVANFLLTYNKLETTIIWDDGSFEREEFDLTDTAS